MKELELISKCAFEYEDDKGDESNQGDEYSGSPFNSIFWVKTFSDVTYDETLIDIDEIDDLFSKHEQALNATKENIELKNKNTDNQGDMNCPSKVKATRKSVNQLTIDEGNQFGVKATSTYVYNFRPRKDKTLPIPLKPTNKQSVISRTRNKT